MAFNPFAHSRLDSNAGGDDWAVISRHNRGIPEIDPAQLGNLIEAVRLVDCREPSELSGPLGAIEGAENVPLRELPERAADWRRDQPIVVVCRSGGRSGQAALRLESMGFKRVASLAGGMLEWRAHRLPVI